MKQIRILGVIVFVLNIVLASAQNITQQLRGSITDRQTQQPLSNVIVEIKNSQYKQITDSNGRFRFDKLPIGTYSISIAKAGYQTLELSTVELVSGKEVILNLNLEEEVHQLKEVTVRGSKNYFRALNPYALVSTRQFGPQEAIRYAGGFQDPARMALAFAGVTTSGSDQNNEIVIRGNSPRGLLWRLEGVEIPNPNHFADGQGSTSGIISMINANNLASSDFMTGAFPSEYGNASSGVFDLNFRRGNNQKWEYNGQISLVGMDIGIEGPLNKNGASIRVGGRYSTLKVLLDANLIQLETSNYNPKFQDINFTVDIPTKKSGTFTIWGLGGNDETFESKNNQKNIDKGTLAVVGLSHKISFKKGYWKTILLASFQSQETFDQILQSNNTWLTNKKLTYNYPTFRFSSSYTHKFSSRVSWQTGVVLSELNYTLNDDRANSKNVLINYLNEDGNTGFIQAYTQGLFKLNASVKSIFGVHQYHFLLNNANAIEPRWSLEINNKSGGKYTTGIGWHSRLEPISIYMYKILLAKGGFFQPNKNLSPSTSFHFVTGFEQKLNEQTKLKIEAYWQNLTGIPIDTSINGYFSLINSGGGIPNFIMTNNGKEINKGIEFTLERFFTKNYYYLFTASLFDSKYENRNNIIRNALFNNNYAGNALIGKEFIIGKYKSISTNFRYMMRGGNRYTPIVLSESIRKNTTVVDGKKIYDAQYPDYWRIDLSISYKINLPKSTWSLGADIQNITNHKNIVNIYYDSNLKNLGNTYALPLIPILFIRSEF